MNVTTAEIQKMFQSFQRRTIPLAEWLGREPTEAEKHEMARLNASGDDNEYFAAVLKMKAKR